MFLTPGNVCIVLVRGTAFLSSVSCIIVSVFYFAAINLQLICWWRMTTQKMCEKELWKSLIKGSVHPKYMKNTFSRTFSAVQPLRNRLGVTARVLRCVGFLHHPNTTKVNGLLYLVPQYKKKYLKHQHLFPESLSLLIYVH